MVHKYKSIYFKKQLIKKQKGKNRRVPHTAINILKVKNLQNRQIRTIFDFKMFSPLDIVPMSNGQRGEKPLLKPRRKNLRFLKGIKTVIMGYCVYHLQKGSGTGSGIGSHIDRTRTVKNADPERTHLNTDLIRTKYSTMPLNAAISARIKEGYNGKQTIRKDAVRYINHVLTGSHEDMKEIFKDKEKRENWIRANFNFICKHFGGEENIVRFTIHMDEKTPHIHCITVPLTADGRLSAREMVGNNKKLQELQDIYSGYMEEFNLERGIRGSNAKHTDIKEFYARINEAKEIEISKVHIPEYEISEPPTLFNRAKWKEEEQQKLKSFIDEAVTKQMNVGADLIELASFKTASEKIKEQEYRRRDSEVNELKLKIKGISVDFNKFKEKTQMEIKELTSEKTKTEVLLKSQKGVTENYKNGQKSLIDILIDVAKGDKSKKDVEAFLAKNKIYTPQINRNLGMSH